MGEPITPRTPSFCWGGTDNFACPHCGAKNVTPEWECDVEALQKLRDWWRAPVQVTSGWRCPVYNAVVDLPDEDRRAELVVWEDGRWDLAQFRAYLTERYPDATLGALYSQHLLSFGRGCFDVVPSLSSYRVAPRMPQPVANEIFALEAARRGWTGIGIYAVHVHLDRRQGLLTSWDSRPQLYRVPDFHERLTKALA